MQSLRHFKFECGGQRQCKSSHWVQSHTLCDEAPCEELRKAATWTHHLLNYHHTVVLTQLKERSANIAPRWQWLNEYPMDVNLPTHIQVCQAQNVKQAADLTV